MDNDQIWQSAKQQNLIHHMVYVLVNIIGPLYLARSHASRLSNFSPRKVVILFSGTLFLSFVWVTSINAAWVAQSQAFSEQGIYPYTVFWESVTMTFSRVAGLSWIFLLLRTLSQQNRL